MIPPALLPVYARTGDVYAYSGRGWVSSTIKVWTWSNVSHVGIAYDGDTIVESTQFDGADGVRKVDAVESVTRYIEAGGKVALLPLAVHWRSLLGKQECKRYLDMSIGRQYDYWQVFRMITPLFRQAPSDSRMFCSELVAAAHIAGGLYETNPSEVTPGGIAALKIYEPKYHAIGEDWEVRGYNTRKIRYKRRKLA